MSGYQWSVNGNEFLLEFERSGLYNIHNIMIALESIDETKSTYRA